MNVTVGFIKLELKKKPLREIPKETASVLFFTRIHTFSDDSCRRSFMWFIVKVKDVAMLE